jgi:hypothetical protein
MNPLSALQVVGIRYRRTQAAQNDERSLHAYVRAGVYEQAQVPFDLIEPQMLEDQRVADEPANLGVLGGQVAEVVATARRQGKGVLMTGGDCTHITGVLLDCEVVLLAVDNMETELAVSRACLARGILVVQCSLYGGALVAQVRTVKGGVAGRELAAAIVGMAIVGALVFQFSCRGVAVGPARWLCPNAELVTDSNAGQIDDSDTGAEADEDQEDDSDEVDTGLT